MHACITGLKRNTSSPVVMICQCITLLGIVLLYTYLADRTPVFTKEEKHFNWTSFAVPLAILGILGFVTYQPVKDASVLNRQQTCETRGWMQLVLLVYHYTGGSKVGYNNSVGTRLTTSRTSRSGSLSAKGQLYGHDISFKF